MTSMVLLSTCNPRGTDVLVQAQAYRSAIRRPSCKLKQMLKIGLNVPFLWLFFSLRSVTVIAKESSKFFYIIFFSSNFPWPRSLELCNLYFSITTTFLLYYSLGNNFALVGGWTRWPLKSFPSPLAVIFDLVTQPFPFCNPLTFTEEQSQHFLDMQKCPPLKLSTWSTVSCTSELKSILVPFALKWRGPV